MTFLERRAQQDPSVPLRTLRCLATGEVLGHFRMSDELASCVARPVPLDAEAERPTFEPLTADGYQRLLASAVDGAA